MTWTYDETLPTQRDMLRMLIGDVVSSEPQLQDEALDLFLSTEGGLYPAASAACRALAGTYARRVDVSNAGLSLAASQRVKHYTTLALEFGRRAMNGPAGGIGAPVVGGVSIDGINADRADPDLVQPQMRHDLHDREGDGLPPASTR